MPSGVHQAYRWPRLLRSVVLFLGRVPNSQSRFACACTCLELSSVPSGEAALFVGHVHTYGFSRSLLRHRHPFARAYVQGTELMRRAVETLSGRAVPRPDDSVNDGSEDPLTLSGVLRGLGDATAARVYEAGRSYAMGLVQHRKPY